MHRLVSPRMAPGIILLADPGCDSRRTPRADMLRSVERMASTTSTIPTARRRELSAAAALMLTIGGGILVIAIAALAAAGVALAAVAVFGSSVLDAL